MTSVSVGFDAIGARGDLPRWFVVSLALLSIVDGCHSGPTDLNASSVAIVYGTVISTDSLPVTGSRLVIRLRDPGKCDGPVDTTSTGDGGAWTDQLGHYRTLVRWLNYQRIERCVGVRALPTAGMNLRDTTVTGAQVEFRSEAITPPIDSVRVDLVLPKNP